GLGAARAVRGEPRQVRRAPGICSAALLAGLMVAAAAPALAARAEAPKPASWRALGDGFESSRLLQGAARLRALEALDGSLAQALRGDLGDEQRHAARFLAARIDFER